MNKYVTAENLKEVLRAIKVFIENETLNKITTIEERCDNLLSKTGNYETLMSLVSSLQTKVDNLQNSVNELKKEEQEESE